MVVFAVLSVGAILAIKNKKNNHMKIPDTEKD